MQYKAMTICCKYHGKSFSFARDKISYSTTGIFLLFFIQAFINTLSLCLNEPTVLVIGLCAIPRLFWEITGINQ